MLVKHKIISGFPCNGGEVYLIITSDYGTLLTKKKEEFDKVMKVGFIELEHEENPELLK